MDSEIQYSFKTFHPNPSLEFFPISIPRIEFSKHYDKDPVPDIRLQQTTKYYQRSFFKSFDLWTRNAFALFKNRDFIGTFNDNLTEISFKKFGEIWDEMVLFGSGLHTFLTQVFILGTFFYTN